MPAIRLMGDKIALALLFLIWRVPRIAKTADHLQICVFFLAVFACRPSLVSFGGIFVGWFATSAARVFCKFWAAQRNLADAVTTYFLEDQHATLREENIEGLQEIIKMGNPALNRNRSDSSILDNLERWRKSIYSESPRIISFTPVDARRSSLRSYVNGIGRSMIFVPNNVPGPTDAIRRFFLHHEIGHVSRVGHQQAIEEYGHAVIPFVLITSIWLCFTTNEPIWGFLSTIYLLFRGNALCDEPIMRYRMRGGYRKSLERELYADTFAFRSLFQDRSCDRDRSRVVEGILEMWADRIEYLREGPSSFKTGQEAEHLQARTCNLQELHDGHQVTSPTLNWDFVPIFSIVFVVVIGVHFADKVSEIIVYILLITIVMWVGSLRFLSDANKLEMAIKSQLRHTVAKPIDIRQLKTFLLSSKAMTLPVDLFRFVLQLLWHYHFSIYTAITLFRGVKNCLAYFYQSCI